jgi:hypothetical protein
MVNIKQIVGHLTKLIGFKDNYFPFCETFPRIERCKNLTLVQTWIYMVSGEVS